MELSRLAAILALLTLFLFSGSALAARATKRPLPIQPAGGYQNKPISLGATVWYCAYGGATEILCRLGDIGSGLVHRAKQVIDPRLPKIVGEILNNPERLTSGHVSIPLHTDPYDFELVGQLAEAVMCGVNSSCGVLFAESLGELATLVGRFESDRKGLVPPNLASAFSLAEADL